MFQAGFLFTLVFLSLQALSQQRGFKPGLGKALIMFEAPEKIVRVNGELWKKDSLVDLAPGRYTVQAWAPKRRLYTDTLWVKENKVTICAKRLKYTKEYKSYKLNKLNVFILRSIPISATLAYSAFAYIEYQKKAQAIEPLLQDALAEKELYEQSVSINKMYEHLNNYNVAKGEYENQLNATNNYAKKAVLISSAGLVCSAGLYWLSKSLEQPKYTEIPLLSLNYLNMETDFKNTYALSVHLNIK